MDALILEAVLPEIREALGGRLVTKVETIGKFGVLVRFRGERRNLFVSGHPELSRLGLLDALPPGPDPSRGPDNLTKPLLGTILETIEQEPGDRVARLRFFRDRDSVTMVAELIPRFANVILLGAHDRILWSRRDFTGDRPRQIAAGLAYEPPPTDPGQRLPDLDRDTIRERIEEGEGELHRRIPRGWGGGPRGPARIFEDAGLDVVERLAELAANARVLAPTLGSHVVSGELHLFPAEPGEIPGWETSAEESPNRTVDRYYRWREEDESTDQLLAELRKTLVKRRSRAAKALRQIDSRMEEAQRESQIRHQAEVLTANLGSARRGMKEIRLPDFDGGNEVLVTLDPKLDARANADALFKKARRLARGREELETQRLIQRSEVDEADRALEKLDPPPTLERLRELAKELAPSILRDRPPSGGAAPRARPEEDASDRGSLPEGFNPRRYELPGGWEVWVGRSSRQNDELTHRHAKQRDLWFHARGCQGSHTVLRASSGKGEPPKEIVLAAASIAAFHSKARNSGLVPVAYAEKRYVRKPRGAPVGTAAMIREKVVMVEPKLPKGYTR